ncbi:SLC13 family permease [Oscillatoria sp. CS-180]|uniref:SLC13 family permease n=1 Tax=Oscillatoria sp. CS-180 TaxID=3021720 RepID=UPI0023307F35|nr:SLC13 family permease [Oscillatoria sp. CS-180]MDB9524611.1 SLC13 family permease [Oscillatoria sp. CS-180]
MQTGRELRRWWTQRRQKQFLALLIFGILSSFAIATMQLVATNSPFATLSWQGWLTLGVTALAFLANAITALPAEIIFLGAVAVLYLAGVLVTPQALSGFSNDGMVTVGVLYIVVTGLQQTGALEWISQKLLGLPKSRSATFARLTVPVMVLSAFLNNTPVVAMFIPVVSDWCRKLRISPSKLMIPLSYASIFGGLCTLIGTSTNLVVSGLLVNATDHPALGLFDITPVGLPCAIAGLIFLFGAQRWLLPNRKPVMSEQDDMRQYTVEMVVAPRSPLAGKTVEQAGLRHLPGLYLAEIARGNQIIPAVSPQETLRENDQLIFVGIVDSILDLQRLRGLEPATDQVFKLNTPRTERRLIEAVVSNTCSLVGRTIREGQFRTRYDAVVLAVARNGERLSGKIGDIRLKPGDTLLLETHPRFLEQQRVSSDFYLVSDLPDSEPLRHSKAPIALVTLLLMVALAGFGVLSMLKAAILAAILMLITRCCSPTRALQSIQWSVLLVIAAALAISEAMQATGAAEAIANTFLSIAGSNHLLALAVVYGITMLLTETITNNAAAALMFPIALSVAEGLGVSYMPFVIAIMIGASASFSTPIGYQTNLMVYGPGGYKFTDFTRIGIPLNLLFWGLTVLIAPLAYPF